MSCYTEIAAVHAMQAALVPMECTATILLYRDSSAWASWGLHSMLSSAREQDAAATLQPLLPGTGRTSWWVGHASTKCLVLRASPGGLGKHFCIQ